MIRHVNGLVVAYWSSCVYKKMKFVEGNFFVYKKMKFVEGSFFLRLPVNEIC